MEFTKLVKYGAASLFLILVIHGLILGFTIPTTVISVVLVSVVCLFEAQLVKSERDQYDEHVSDLMISFGEQVDEIEKKVSEQVKKLSDMQYSDKKEVLMLQAKDKEELIKKIDNTDSKISAIKLSQGIKRL